MSANKVNVGLLVHLEAKPGKEGEVEQFLKSGLAVVHGEPATITWYAIRLSATTFGIFDTFPDNAGRDTHLNGKLATALMAKAGDLFSKPPQIEKVEILSTKLS
jgi:quinol monooxygenase YgiN